MRGLHSQRTTSIRIDHLDDPPSISEHVHRHDDDDDDGMAETHAVFHHSLSPDGEVSPPRLGSASSSSLKRPATLGPASDALRRQALEHRPIEEPGIPADNIHPYVHVLVPTGHHDRDGACRSPDDARHLAEKKPVPARKGYRKPMDESERQAIKQNRKYGVCLRCKLFKERCRGGIPCERCRSLKVWKSICVPAQFTEKAVFNRDIYGGRLGLLYANIDSWASDHQLKYGMPESSSRFDISGFDLDNGPKEVDVSNGYPPVLRVKAHHFVPIDRVLLEHILWRAPGKPGYNRLPSTSYGLKEEIASDALDDYIDSNFGYIFEDIKSRRAGTDPCIVMHIDTIEAAYEYANSNKNLSLLVRKALRIWTAQNFFFSNAWRICSAETLEMSNIDNPESKLHGVIPLPRLMNQQLDYYVENRVATLEKELLAELQARILDRNPNEWFGIFLAIYIHLCSIERDNWCLSTWNHDKDILIERVRQLEISSQSQKLKRGPEKAYIWPVKMCPSELIKKNEHLADMLVSHFRTISRGYVPFTLDWDQKQVVQMAGNEREAVDYMKSMSTHVSKFERNLLARLSAEYSREDAASLDGIYTSKLMLSDE
ncbi:hypothetical protein FPQ18DRAFT_328492 [Pyronema domesticum]|nr:hypothetical protein FPQ18DRAFT_328492 [Pyronema domesticum]